MKKPTVTGAILMIAGVVALGFLFWTRKPRPSEARRSSAGVRKIENRADLLVDQLEKHPVRPSQRTERSGLYLLDVDQGVATLIVDEPAPGMTHCGSARWSRDGTQVFFDATPGNEWNKTHLFAIKPGDLRPIITDLGPGNCPSPSPDGTQIVFLINSGALPGADRGLWIMNSDGSGRRALGSYGRPFWSPGNRQLLIVSFSDPCRLTLMDVASRKTRPIQLPGQEVYSIPSWVDDKTLVAVVATGDQRSIALIDVTDPGQARIGEVLREANAKPSVTPAYPTYSIERRRCVFVHANPKGMSVYAIEQGENARAKRVERDGFDTVIADLALAPDGRHALFCSNGSGRKAP